MGKKDKDKKKLSGIIRTILKTEKKRDAKQKKELAARGEEDIEKVVAEIERQETRRHRLTEVVVDPPSRRVNFTLTAHPFRDELIMLGGEYHDGRQTIVYGDMFFYNIKRDEWTVLKAPCAPPPRCGHQAVATSLNKGELWVFGGEFSSPTESQFHHYKDLWVYRLGERKWEKIISSHGPSPRSGHRMAYLKKQLIIFGGFHDNLREYKYFNDVYIFNMDTYRWTKIEPTGTTPPPRSGCIFLPTSDNKLLVYGGYSKEKVKKDVDKGQIHSDMYILSTEDDDVTRYKWISVKQTGFKVSPRCSASGTLIQSNQAYIFGGVYDEEDSDEELRGIFYNDLLSLEIDKFQWHTVSLLNKRDAIERRRRRKQKGDDGDAEEEESNDEIKSNSDDAACAQSSLPAPDTAQTTTVTDDDGVFTVTVGPTSTASNSSAVEKMYENVFFPTPRINPGMAVKNNILYLYGGMIEDGDRQYTLCDFYSLDCRKLDEWKVLLADDLSSQTWFETSSSDSENDEGNDEDESDSDDESTDLDKKTSTK